jgi:PAS domain-containing protein
VRRKDGTVFPGEVTARQTPGGRIQGFIRDVTARKQAEEALRRSELPSAKSNGCKTGGLERDLLPVDFLRQIR